MGGTNPSFPISREWRHQKEHDAQAENGAGGDGPGVMVADAGYYEENAANEEQGPADCM